MVDKQKVSHSENITRSTFVSLTWMVSGTGIQTVLNLLVMAILARLISPAEFGLLGAAMLFISFAKLFSEMGIGSSIIQLPTLTDAHIRVGFTISIVFGIMLWLTVTMLSPSIANFMRMDDLEMIVRILAYLYLIQAPMVVAKSLMAREMRFRQLAGMNVLSYFIGFAIIGIPLAWLGFGVWAMVTADLVQAFCLTCFVLYWSRHSKRFLWDRFAFNDLFYLGGGFTLSRFGNRLALQGDYLVVGRWLGEAALGLYSRAYQLMIMPATLFGQALDQVLFSSMAKVQVDKVRLSTGFRRGLTVMTLLILPFSVFAIMLAPEIITVILGSNWTEAIVPFQILATGMLFRNGYKISDAIARATGVVYRQAQRQWIYACLVILGAWIGHYWGIVGVSVGTVIAVAVHYLLMSNLSLSLINLKWNDFFKFHLPGLALAVFVGVFGWPVVVLLRYLELTSLIVLFLAMLWLLPLLLVIVLWFPRYFLGTDGMWMIKLIMSYLPTKTQRIGPIKWLVKQLTS